MSKLSAEQSDEQLAAAAAREDSAGIAFTELVRRYEQRVWRICYRLLNDEQDALDAAQEVLVRLFTHRSDFQQRSKYSTWVHGVAVRTCLGIRRTRQRHRQRQAEAARTWRDREGKKRESHPEQALDLWQMLETLSEEDRALMILKFAEGYEYEELAALFDLTPSACKMRISRSRKKLNQQFGLPETPETTDEPDHGD